MLPDGRNRIEAILSIMLTILSLLLFTPLASAELGDGPNRVDAKVEGVWPHDIRSGGVPIQQAAQANILAYLFKKDTLLIMPDTFNDIHAVRLWKAVDNGIEEPAGIVTPYVTSKRLTPKAGPDYWVINDVDVHEAQNPEHQVFFRLSVDNSTYSSNIWAHAIDGRTFNPKPASPSGIANDIPTEVDAHIVVVYPRDGVSVTEADFVNVRVLLFGRGATMSVPTSWEPSVLLQRSKNTGLLYSILDGPKVVQPQKTILTSADGSFTFPAWDFNDIPVSDARDPKNRDYFRVGVEGVTTRSNIWAHGADGRTFFPQPDIPRGVAAE